MKKFRTKLAIFSIVAMLNINLIIPITSTAVATSSSELLDIMNQAYYHLESGERTHLQNTMDATALLNYDTANLELIDEVWEKIAVKLQGNEVTYLHITQEKILSLFAFLGLIYVPGDDPLNGTIASIPSDIQSTLDQLVELSMLGGTIGTITQDKLAAFALSLQTEALNELPTTFDGLLDLARDKQELKAFLNDSVGAIMDDVADPLDFVELLQFYDVNKADLQAVLTKIADKVDPSKDAIISMMLGYARSKTNVPFLGNPYDISVDLMSHQYDNINFNHYTGIPVTGFRWEATGGTAELINDSYLSVISNSAPNVVTVRAYFDIGDGEFSLLNNRLLFETDIYLGERSSDLSLFNSDTDTFLPGNSFVVSYKLQGFAADDITNSAQLDINFDSSVFELADATIEDSLIVGSLPGEVTYSDGHVGYLLTDDANAYHIYNRSDVYRLHLKVKENVAPGSYTFTSPQSEIELVYMEGGVLVDEDDWELVTIPSSTLTVNVASDGSGSLLSGYAKWRTAGDKAGITVNVLSGTDVVNTTTTDADGLFNFTLSDGTYSLEFVKAGYLKRTINTVVIAGQNVVLSTAGAEIDLLAGDITADGLINFQDLNALLSVYNATQSNQNYSEAIDLTRDGLINFADLNILLSNYNKTIASYSTWVW